MSWSSTSSCRRDRRPILTTRWALARDEHTQSHSHGANEGENPPADQAHAHSHGEHSHAHSHSHGEHSHGEHSQSHGDEPSSWPRGSRSETQNVVRAPYAFRRNAPLARGAGRGLCLFVDAFTAGVAGDMFVAAALDLGVPLDAVREPLAALSETPTASGVFGGYTIDVVHDEKSCIVAPRFVVAEDGGVPQPMRDYAEIKNMLATCVGMREGVRARAAVLCRARRGRGGGARDGRGGSTLPRGRGGGQRG